jgi:cellulose synthase/poly-beta-1,6-N-acetylglucosamine synthase-like glycosyltransferase
VFFSIFLTCVVSLGISTLLLLAFARHVPIRSVFLGGLLAILVAAVSGEAAARIWDLPSRHVLAGEALLVGTGLVAVALLHRWNPVGQLFYGSFLGAAFAYLAFAGWYTVRGGLSPIGTAASGVLFFLECSALTISAWYAFDSCDAICRPKPSRPEPAFDQEHKPMVSLQIAAYNEPPDMLIKTIQSAEAMDYPNFEVVVIDNNTKDPEVWKPVEEYCKDRPRVRFIHVDEWPGFKAGALNLALTKYTDPKAEIVGVIDADYILDPSYLESVVGYFTDQKIAFVQTPQDYRDWSGDPYLTACADAYEYFFATTMPSRNDRDSIIFAGTMGLLRRSVLEEMGGWEEWCITEDSEASLRILKAGYSGLYVGRSFGKGIMPLTFASLKSQRFRWALGGIQIVKRHWRDLMPGGGPDNHLSPAQKMDYLMGSLQWMNDLIYLAFTVVLLASGVLLITTGRVAIRPLLGAVTLLPAALIGSGLLRALWALRVRVKIGMMRALRAFANWLSLSWTVALACVTGLVRRDAVFLRTPKTEERLRLFDAIRAAKTETFLALALWGMAAYIAVTDHPTTLLLVLFVWQGAVYATALYMSWLNQAMKLPPELEERRRTEWLRQRAARRWAVFGSAMAAVVLVAALFGLLTAGGRNPGQPVNPFTVPQRAAGDTGPLANLVNGVPLAPPPASSSSPTPTESISPSPSPTESFSPSPSPSLSPSPTESASVSPSPSPS